MSSGNLERPKSWVIVCLNARGENSTGETVVKELTSEIPSLDVYYPALSEADFLQGISFVPGYVFVSYDGDPQELLRLEKLNLIDSVVSEITPAGRRFCYLSHHELEKTRQECLKKKKFLFNIGEKVFFRKGKFHCLTGQIIDIKKDQCYVLLDLKSVRRVIVEHQDNLTRIDQ